MVILGARALQLFFLYCSYFVKNRNELARSIYSKSLHPQHGYPFAIVGIHITASIHKLLVEGDLKAHFYNDTDSFSHDKAIENIHEIFGN